MPDENKANFKNITNKSVLYHLFMVFLKINRFKGNLFVFGKRKEKKVLGNGKF